MPWLALVVRTPVTVSVCDASFDGPGRSFVSNCSAVSVSVPSVVPPPESAAAAAPASHQTNNAPAVLMLIFAPVVIALVPGERERE